MKLQLLPNTSAQQAEELLQQMRAGHIATTDNLEVLDQLLRSNNGTLEVWSGDKQWDIDLLQRIRFQRGLDPRPSL